MGRRKTQIVVSSSDESEEASTSEESDEDEEEYVPPKHVMRKLAKRPGPETRNEKKRAGPKRILKEIPLPFKVTKWPDLVNLGRASKALPPDTVFTDCERLSPELVDAIENINKIVGMETFKERFYDFILMYLQTTDRLKMNHIVITGQPGTGKTTLAHAIAGLFYAMGKLKSRKIINGSRANMIAGYVGHTSKKTRKLIESALGGCLIIDEAYTLGTGADTGDSFSQECMDTLNQCLTEHGEDFQCIIVGYKDALQANVFSHNDGLERRFQWRFDLPPADDKQLCAIFRKMGKEAGLTIDEGIVDESWFKENKQYFKHSGGSVQNFVDKLKLAHYRHAFGSVKEQKSIITKADIELALKLHQSVEHSKEDEERQAYVRMMFT